MSKSNQKMRVHGLAGASLAALTALFSASAVAQTADDGAEEADPAVIGDVIITAQRRDTNLQTTAAAVAAFSGEALEARSITNIEDLGRLAPSMDVSLYQGEAQVYIRGIGYTGLIGGTDSSTAVHLNGVYLSRSSAAVPGFMDVNRVEVVRGPQGTLYGRNATSGSVNIISNGPTDYFTAEGALTVGDYNRYQVFGAVGGPIAGDAVAGRIAVQVESRDGYTDVTRPDGSQTDVEDQEDIAARLSLSFRPSESFTFDLIGDYYKADDAASVWLYFGPGTATNPFIRQYIADNGGVTPQIASRDISSEAEAFNRPEIWGLTGRATWDIGDFTFASITGYRRTHPRNFNDLDVTSAFAITQYREEDHEQVSQEFQLTSPSERPLEWIVGLYYFNETNDVRNEYQFRFIDDMLIGADLGPACCTLELNGQATTEALAAFGEVNYDLTDRVNLVLGGRYSTETRGGNNRVRLANFPSTALDNSADFEDATFNAFTPKAGLNFTLSDNLFAYVSASRGFKSGGFNIGSYQNTPFRPEKIWSYEAGLRADLFDQRLRLNLTAFHYDYTDLQVQDVEGSNTVVRNAASATINGLELESTALLSRNFEVDLSATYLDSQFEGTCLADPKYPLVTPEAGCTGPSQRNLEGFQLPRAPEFKFSIGAQYTFDLGNSGDLTFRGDYSHQTRVYFSSFEVEELSQEPFGWLKARVTYAAPSGHWDLAAFVDNITDERVISNATYIADIVDSTITGNMSPPRTYGLQLRVRR